MPASVLVCTRYRLFFSGAPKQHTNLQPGGPTSFQLRRVRFEWRPRLLRGAPLLPVTDGRRARAVVLIEGTDLEVEVRRRSKK